jgi:signal transduction histidine kinase/streptogramin lyase
MLTGRLYALPLLILFFVFQLFSLHAQTYASRHYTVENGLASSTVYWTLQDHNGFIWFGTDAGVTRFDGTNFKQFTTGDGLSDDEVLKIYEDRKGRIWFLTFNGKLSYYLNGDFHNTKNDSVLKKAISDSHYHSFLEDSNGDLWFGTIKGSVVRIRGNTVKEVRLAESMAKKGWTAIYENAEKKISVIYADCWQENINDSLRVMNYKIKPFNIIILYNIGTGKALALNEDGIIKIDNDSTEWIIKNKEFDFNLVNNIFSTGKSIWLSTNGKGCYFYKDYSTGKAPEVLLKNKVVCSTMQDKEGNIWVSTAGEGVYMFPANYSTTLNYQEKDGLAADNLYSVTRDAKGGTWVGLSNGMLNRIYNNKITSYDARFDDTPYQRVLKIISDRDNNIWCVTDRVAILFSHANNDAYQKRPLNILPNAFKSISEDKQGNIFLTYFLGVYKISREKILNQDYQCEILNKKDSLRTYNSFTDHRGTMWSSTIKGLNSFDGKSLVYYSTGTELENKRITSIGELGDSLLVLATDGYGILFFRNGKIVLSITKNDGLNSNVCHSLFISKNKVWVATSSGINKIELIHNRFSVTGYTTANGLLSNEVRDIYDDDSLLYAATSKGLSIINYNFKAVSSPAPDVFFSTIMVDNRPTETTDHFKLSYASKNIIINFVAITFQNPEKLIYQYRLNRSEKWIESKNHQVEFFSLSPGKYEFEVRAKKFNSVWSKPSLLSFEIIPPFWKTWLFRLLLMLLSSGGIFLLVRQYFRRKIHEQMLVVHQQGEIEKERSRIASDMHDDLGSDVTRISMLSRIMQDENTPVAQIKVHSKKIIHTSNEILQKMDEIIWALNSSNRRIENLFSYINGFALEYFEGSRIDCHVTITENLPEFSLSAIQRRNIFLVVKEALNNIIKHAGASKVDISLSADADGIVISISDNGRGYDGIELPAERNGIKNMKKRLLEINGHLDVITSIENGTVVNISMPVNKIIVS